MYKILVSCLSYDNGQSGISDYINHTIEELSKDHQLDVIILKKDVNIFPIKNKNIDFIEVSDKLARPLFSMLWHLFILPFKIKKGYDLIFLPAGNRRLLCRYPIFTITTFHDLSQFHIEQKYDRFRMFYIQRLIPFFLKKVHIAVAVSKATKDDMIKFYKMDENKIKVAYNGYDRERFNAKPATKTTCEILGFDKKYILYVARIEHPGKNHMNLIKAYEMLPEENKEEYNLVCAGGFKERSEEVLIYARNSKDHSRLKFPGFVPDADMSDLYKNASLFAMPSLYEGFGIPLVEAMACNIPVISSDRGPLPEVGEDAVLFFNPDKPEDIKDKIALIITNEKLKKELTQKGLEQVKKFNWKKHADEIINIFEEYHEKH